MAHGTIMGGFRTTPDARTQHTQQRDAVPNADLSLPRLCSSEFSPGRTPPAPCPMAACTLAEHSTIHALLQLLLLRRPPLPQARPHLLGAGGQLDTGDAGIGVVGHDDGVVTGGAGQGAAVAGLLQGQTGGGRVRWYLPRPSENTSQHQSRTKNCLPPPPRCTQWYPQASRPGA